MYHLDEVRPQYKNGGNKTKKQKDIEFVKHNTRHLVQPLQQKALDWLDTHPIVESFVNNDNELNKELNTVFTFNPIANLNPDIVKEVMDLESTYNPYSNNGTHYGLVQMDRNRFVRLYGENEADKIINEYKNKTRSLKDVANDSHRHLSKLVSNIKLKPNEKVTFGRVMVNQFAPNSSINAKVSDTVWDKNIKNMINSGALPASTPKNITYKQLAYYFDNFYIKDKNDRYINKNR